MNYNIGYNDILLIIAKIKKYLTINYNVGHILSHS